MLRTFRFLAGLALLAAATVSVQAAEIKVEARLIWGANKPYTEEKYKEVDPATAEKLKRIFVWKHYYEINKVGATIPARGTKRLKMSEPCEIEITELEGPKVEVKLFGKGKPVNRFVKPLSKGESFIIGSDDKDSCAWFIVITEL